jgi:glycosyltransferase involved in cell wall biosynthesis
VHAQYEPGLYNLFFLPFLFKMLKSRGIKTFLTLHGRDYFPLTVFHRRMLYPLSDRIIVHNDTHKNLLPEEVREKVAVIPMGITKINGRFDKKSVKNFLFFGYASPYKGLEYLIEAFSKIHENFNDSKLFIHSPVNPIHSAEGEYQEKIDGLIDNLGLKDSTVFVRSYTKRELLPSIRAQTTVFPYKRSYSAGQSAALLDSIASGKAVIVTKVPGIFERVNDGETGLIVEPENVGMLQKAMENLLENPKLVERMSRNNLRLAKDLSWKNIAKRTLRLYKE